MSMRVWVFHLVLGKRRFLGVGGLVRLALFLGIVSAAFDTIGSKKVGNGYIMMHISLTGQGNSCYSCRGVCKVPPK